MKAWQGGERAWLREVADEAAVQRLAAEFARVVEPPLVVYLRGDLGAGKTTFARAFVHARGYQGYVKSPSYGLLETYAVPGLSVLHLDLYRIEDPEELEYLAIRDQFGDDSVLLVEWPDRGTGFLPEPDVVLDFGEKDAVRFIQCSACTPAGRGLAAKVQKSNH